MSTKLFVGNLSSDTSGDDLRLLFGEVGLVESCQLIIDHETGRSKGFAFIEMDSIESCDAAKEKFNGKELHGQAIKVNDAKPKNGFKNSASHGGSRRF